ncbi:MAG: hypothetical protein P1U87_20875 [Verrucomicrobiales bacterium]|nr:hypothetical protein [Verrucomicrobiales bacterium]
MRPVSFYGLLCLLALAISSCSRAPEEISPADTAEEEKSGNTTAVPLPRPDDRTASEGVATDETRTLTGTGNPDAGATGTEHLDGRERELAKGILEMPGGEAQALALTELIRRWAVTDLEEAISFGEELTKDFGENSDIRRAFYRGVADKMAVEYPEQLLDVIGGGLWWDGQWEAEREAMNRVAETDFPRTIEHFTNTSPNKQFPEESYDYSRRIATEQSIEDALQFAEALDRPLSQGFAIRAAVRSWAETDVGAATRYIEDLDDGYLQSHAIDGLIGEIWKTNPQESVTWALAMTDAELRQNTLVKLALTWNSPEGNDELNRLLNHQQLTEAEKTAINERLSGPNE